MPKAVTLPSSFGSRALLGFGVIAFAVVGTSLFLLVGLSRDPWVTGVMYFVAGAVIVIRAWVIRRRPALVFDDEGIRRGDGELLAPWSDAALIWFGHDAPRAMGRSMHPYLWVWTAPALDFTRRTGLEPTALVSTSVPTTVRVEEVVDLLRGFASCPVVSGDAVRLRELVQSLRSGSQA